MVGWWYLHTALDAINVTWNQGHSPCFSRIETWFLTHACNRCCQLHDNLTHAYIARGRYQASNKNIFSVKRLGVAKYKEWTPNKRWIGVCNAPPLLCQSRVFWGVWDCAGGIRLLSLIHHPLRFGFINTLWPNDAIWQQKSGATLVPVMAWERQAKSCWSIINGFCGLHSLKQFLGEYPWNQPVRWVWQLHFENYGPSLRKWVTST